VLQSKKKEEERLTCAAGEGVDDGGRLTDFLSSVRFFFFFVLGVPLLFRPLYLSLAFPGLPQFPLFLVSSRFPQFPLFPVCVLLWSAFFLFSRLWFFCSPVQLFSLPLPPVLWFIFFPLRPSHPPPPSCFLSLAFIARECHVVTQIIKSLWVCYCRSNGWRRFGLAGKEKNSPWL